jgi:hypothetical protein
MYSRDISPCDVFLFSDLKTKLKGEDFEMMEEMQEQAEELLGLVTSDTMRRGYPHWIEKLNKVIRTYEDYF